ncbi:MAG: cation:proton antiporter [Gammaproteobacteria bacterium]|nr:cation:proton antiporter [Gammaproteobacteria bacterium]
MQNHDIVYLIFLIFTGAAIIATVALYARQALLVAYIALGIIFGPYSLQLISDPAIIADISNVGIIFLLFLLGLNLEPADLGRLMREATVVTLTTSICFFALGFSIGLLAQFTTMDACIIGVCLMFSSTIIGLKLLPTTALHHQRMGEVIVSILLLQDIIAVIVLLALQGAGHESTSTFNLLQPLLGLPAIAIASHMFAKIVITKLLATFDRIQEYIFLVAIGWCLGIAELAQVMGLSHEIGAFIAGVSLATNPVSRYIAEALKPLRDFFLIMFFFTLGAGLNLPILGDVIWAALALALGSLLIKPIIFYLILRREKERASLAKETGVRLGQISEFSLLIVIVASEVALLSNKASNLVQVATILTFIASSYWIVLRYPTPIAVDEKLRRD